MLLTAILPDPEYLDGLKRKEIYGESPAELARELREWITISGYGASAIGSKFSVYRDGNVVATICYNGKFDWRDPAYAGGV